MNKDTAIKTAKQLFYDYRKMRNWGKDFDHWVGLSDEWDLNIWSDDDATLHATLYPVVNGKTNTTIADCVA